MIAVIFFYPRSRSEGFDSLRGRPVPLPGGSVVLSTSFEGVDTPVGPTATGYALTPEGQGVRFGVEPIPASADAFRLVDPLRGKLGWILFPGKTDPDVVPLETVPGSELIVFTAQDYRGGKVLRDTGGMGWLGVSNLTGPLLLALVPAAPVVWNI